MSKIRHQLFGLNKREKDNFAACNECKQTISCPQGNTSTMRRHLLCIHHIYVNQDDSEIEPRKKRTMDNFVVKTSLEELVSKLAALDGFSIWKITHSEFIHQSLSLKGIKLPTDQRSVMALIRDFEEKVKQQNIQDIKKELSELKRFSISLDEWTSIGNRRFLNINLHTVSSKYQSWSYQNYGSCNAERMNELVEEHLNFVGVSFKQDSVASTGDGASVMNKLGETSAALYQACIDHGLHLGVTKQIYKENCPGQEISVFSSEEIGQTEDFDESDDELSAGEFEIQS